MPGHDALRAGVDSAQTNGAATKPPASSTARGKPVLLLAPRTESPIPALLQPRNCGSRAAELRRLVLGDTMTATH